MTYVYDIETYPNLFCVVFNNKGQETVFEISARINDYDMLVDFYDPENIEYAIGFNNVKFDAQVLQYLVDNYKSFINKQGSEIVGLIYEFAQDTIEKMNNKEFPLYPEWRITVPQIDLFAINHYNNKARMTSLKWIEFSINHPKVQDLPYKFNMPLRLEYFDEVIEYCKNDVSATRSFAEECKDLITLRIAQNQQYPELRLLNKPDSTVGEKIFLKVMSESMGIEMKTLKEMRTPRAYIEVKDILLPYINFKTPEFQAVHDFYKEARSGGLSKSVMFGGISFEFGEGGLHASWDDKIFEADDDYMILDIDVNVTASRNHY